MMLEKEKEAFVNTYKRLYFQTAKRTKKEKILGKNVHLIGTEKDIEDCIFPDDKIPKGNIELKHIAWKAGRLTKEALDKTDIPHLNGQGKEIQNLDKYLGWVNENRKQLEEMVLEEAVKALCKYKQAYDVRNLGSVYVFAILFFVSGGKYPIYDKYAHTAVKALYLDRNPKDIFVGEAPQVYIDTKEKMGKTADEIVKEIEKKNERYESFDKSTDKILGMYKEYCWMLEQVFGSFSIPRKLDRALWVYGHSRIQFPRDMKKAAEE